MDTTIMAYIEILGCISISIYIHTYIGVIDIELANPLASQPALTHERQVKTAYVLLEHKSVTLHFRS